MARTLGLPCALLLVASAIAHGAAGDEPERIGVSSIRAGSSAQIADSTWVDHDRRAIRRPPDWQPDFWSFHSPAWWRDLWEKSELVDVKRADLVPNGGAHWLR